MTQPTGDEVLEELRKQASPLLERARRLDREGTHEQRDLVPTIVTRLEAVQLLSTWIGPYVDGPGASDHEITDRLLSVEESLETVAAALLSEEPERIASTVRLLADRLDYVLSYRKTVLGTLSGRERDGAVAAFEETRQRLAVARELDAAWAHGHGSEAERELTTGAEADQTIGWQYRDEAGREEVRSQLWTMVVLTSIFLLAGIGYWVYLGRTGQWTDMAARAAVAVPIAGFIPYAVSESRDHRRHARWARSVALQLLTLDPFVRRLDKDRRVQVIAEFGATLFAAPARDFGRRDAGEHSVRAQLRPCGSQKSSSR